MTIRQPALVAIALPLLLAACSQSSPRETPASRPASAKTIPELSPCRELVAIDGLESVQPAADDTVLLVADSEGVRTHGLRLIVQGKDQGAKAVIRKEEVVVLDLAHFLGAGARTLEYLERHGDYLYFRDRTVLPGSTTSWTVIEKVRAYTIHAP